MKLVKVLMLLALVGIMGVGVIGCRHNPPSTRPKGQFFTDCDPVAYNVQNHSQIFQCTDREGHKYMVLITPQD